MFSVRSATADDSAAILALHRTVAATPGGVVRAPDEVTPGYIDDAVRASLARGVIVVAEGPSVPGLMGELHTYRDDIAALSHVLAHLTVAVHPAAQGRGVGRALFEALLRIVELERPAIERIELMVRESNVRGRRLYEAVGFVEDGRLERHVRAASGELEADITMGWLRPRRGPAEPAA